MSESANMPCAIALRTGKRSFVDFDVPESENPDGSRRMLMEAGYRSGQSTPLVTRSGKIIGMVSTHWRKHHRPSERELQFLDLLARQAADLIEQRQTVAEREQLLAREQAARVEADRANRIKDEFLAVLSHELRSPLNPILGWSKLLQTGKLDPDKTQQALQTIERNAKLQAELIEDLLDVSRILQGKLSLNVAPVKLASTIRAAMETVRLAAEAKAIIVEANLSPDVGLVSGDATRLQQVLWNLLSNAVKFTPPRGRVHIQLEQVDSCAHITVSDTGQGIEPDFRPYVFDYFRQANAATTRKFGGLGLGLAIVRHLVELHGGTVGVESLGEGQGATFTVELPLMPIPVTANQPNQLAALAPALNGIQVLVVDDEPDSREFVTFVLEQAGAKVITATTAEEALTTLIRSQPNVLLSDIGMPDMDGYMLMQRVRALPPEQGGQVRAIALTAYAGEMNQQQALQAGFQRHLAKPVEPEVLVGAIASLINHT
jgi:signal transduction histidine kinase/ActR/RegA family two-component response regulator